MNIIRKLESKDVDDFAEINCNAFPWIGYEEKDINRLKEFLKNCIENFSKQDLYGLFRNEKLLGGMCLYEFKMNIQSVITKVGGIGSVAVDLLHKKEKVTKDLIIFALNYYKSKGVSMVTLYPFNVSFYKNMGFGYGSQMKQYRVNPESFPKGTSKDHIQFLSDDDRIEVLECYNRFFHKTNGLAEKLDESLSDLFDFSQNRLIGYRKEGRILGYLVFSFQKHYQYKNDLIIHELVYDNENVLFELCTFLYTQSDQIDRIIIDTQDEFFHFLLSDPTSGTFDAFSSKYLETFTNGVGIMYRIIDVEMLFISLHSHNFNGQSCKLKINIRDNLFESNQKSTIIHFISGVSHVEENSEYEVEMSIGVGEFSSLIMGAIDFKSLQKYGLAHLSDNNYENIVNNIFRTEQKPMCLLHF